MKKYNKIIFVCNGNTCRSPMAATIMRSMCKDRDILVASRGLVVLFPEPYNPKALAMCSAHNLIMPSHPAQQIAETDFGNDTLVLTMQESQKNKLYNDYANAINVYTIGEYAGEENPEDVEDPYGQGIEAYKQCFDRLYGLVEKVSEKMFS